MAERNLCSSCNSGMKVVALKEALCTQQQLLQKLYIELEEEREASATAASEALSMILRLQGEKAAEKMEAVHYRRMAEEKMQHAEESLMIFRELLCEKEMEIASLTSQVEGYRRKQLVIGEAQLGELCVQGMIGRSRSSLVDIIDGMSTKVVSEKENQGIPELYPKKSDEVSDRELLVPKADTQSFFDKFAVGDLCSYREQIKQLDEQLKEISHCCLAKQETGSRKTEQENGRRLIESNCNSEGGVNSREVDENSSTASGLCDIFEVPNDQENGEICQLRLNELVEDENRLKKPESIPQGRRSCCSKDESKFLKNTRQHAPQVKNKVTIHGAKPLGNRKGSGAASRAQVQKLRKRLAKLECERRGWKQEISDKGDEELMLLKEINQKLDMIESDIRSSKVNKVESGIRSMNDTNCRELEERTLVSIMEETFFYSI